MQTTRDGKKVKGGHDWCDTVGEDGLGARSPPAGALHAHAAVGEHRAHAPRDGSPCTHTQTGRRGGGWQRQTLSTGAGSARTSVRRGKGGGTTVGGGWSACPTGATRVCRLPPCQTAVAFTPRRQRRVCGGGGAGRGTACVGGGAPARDAWATRTHARSGGHSQGVGAQWFGTGHTTHRPSAWPTGEGAVVGWPACVTGRSLRPASLRQL